MTPSPGSVLGNLRERAGLSLQEASTRLRINATYLARVEHAEAFPAPAWFGWVAGIYAESIADKARR